MTIIHRAPSGAPSGALATASGRRPRAASQHARLGVLLAAACFALAAPAVFAAGDAAQPQPDAQAQTPAPAGGYDYPTQGRVEYVLGCMDDNGHDFANVYKCSCVIDKMAAVVPYDEFVDQSTSAKYATLGGEGGSEFRVDRVKDATKHFRALQSAAYHACGLGPGTKSAAK